MKSGNYTGTASRKSGAEMNEESFEPRSKSQLSGKWRPYPAYKDSGVEWLGKIPAHWEVQKLKYVSSVRFSSVDKKSTDTEIPVLLCNYVDVYKNKHITSNISFMEATATTIEIDEFKLNKGDVLVTKDSESWEDIAVPAYVLEDIDSLLCGYHLAQIRSNSVYLNSKYLFWSFCAIGFNYQFRVAATGITRYGLGKYWLDNALFLIPSIEEQEAIANFLERETGEIEALVAKKERQIELLQEKRTALISRAVTRGLDPNVPLKDSGIDWLGPIPAHWEVLRLKFLISFVHFCPAKPGLRLTVDNCSYI
jgi:type I restriction enzyme, S subunit